MIYNDVNKIMDFLKKNLYQIYFSTFVFMLPAFMLYAQTHVTICDPAGGKICNPINQSDIGGFIKTLLEGILRIGIPIIALAIIYCGFLFVAARGNPEKISKAKGTLLYTLIGAAILLGSWAIAKLISTTVTGLGS